MTCAFCLHAAERLAAASDVLSRLAERDGRVNEILRLRQLLENNVSELAARLDAILADNPHPTSVKFYAALVECAELFAKKNHDYGAEDDPLRNIKSSENLGIPAWKGSWLRAKDKVTRLDTYCLKGSLANEGVQDSWLDLSVYCLICLVLFREGAACP